MDFIKYIKEKIAEKKDILEKIAQSDVIFNPILSIEKIKQFEAEI